MTTVADSIKQQLSMDQVARMYGFQPNRGGYIACPFHSERTPSLKIYMDAGRGFHCYGCNIGGSVIDFVMRLLSLPYQAAVVRLNSDFHLGLSSDKPDPREIRRLADERREAERQRRAFEREYDTRCAEHRRLWQAKQTGPEHPDYVEACLKLDALDDWFQEHPFKR